MKTLPRKAVFRGYGLYSTGRGKLHLGEMREIPQRIRRIPFYKFSFYPGALLLLSGLLTWALTGCDKPEQKFVAIVGNQTISPQEFRNAYYKFLEQPEVFDSEENRTAFLDELINRKLLAKEARRLSFDQNEYFLLKREAYRNNLLKKQHFNEVIAPQIQTPDTLMREIHSYLTEQRKLKHIFAPTAELAESYRFLLENGTPWDTLAAFAFRQPMLRENGGDLGWVYWDQLEYDMGMAAFRLPVGVISDPVKSSFGYHILKVENFKKTPLRDEWEFAHQHKYVRDLVHSRIGDLLAHDYITEMMAETEILPNPDAMAFMDSVHTAVFVEEDVPNMVIIEHLDHGEVQQMEQTMWDRRNDVLISIDGIPMTIGEYGAALQFIPVQAAKHSFKTALDYVLRDFKLKTEGQALGLEQHPQVNILTDIYEDYLLQLDMRRTIISSIRITEDELRTAFEELKDPNSPSTFENSREVIEKHVMNLRRARAVPETVAKLKKGQLIEKNPKLMNQVIDRMYQSGM